jgi:hypothetical protein
MEGFMLCFKDAMEMSLQQLLGSWERDAIPLGLQLVAVAHKVLPRPDGPQFHTAAVARQLRELASISCADAVVVCPFCL